MSLISPGLNSGRKINFLLFFAGILQNLLPSSFQYKSTILLHSLFPDCDSSSHTKKLGCQATFFFFTLLGHLLECLWQGQGLNAINNVKQNKFWWHFTDFCLNFKDLLHIFLTFAFARQFKRRKTEGFSLVKALRHSWQSLTIKLTSRLLSVGTYQEGGMG